MRKLVGSAVALVLVATMVAACGGYTQEEAEARCTQEAAAHAGGACFDGSTTQSCVDAHMECGDEAVEDGACPLKYSCPTD
ncbi:MAG: hypothetical protein U0414_22840 [Polyangiaceae bacterium]